MSPLSLISFNIVYIVLGGHARTAGKTSQQTYIPFVMKEAMSWVGWRKFYYYCRNIMGYLVEILNVAVLTAMCMYGYLILIAVV